MRAEVVADGVPFGEGPVWCPDGTLVVTSVAAGALFRVRPADGSILVTQNGGFDVGATGFVRDAPAVTSSPATPGLQLVAPDGTVTYLLDEGFHAPNDLCVAPDGTVFFTDPGHYPPPEPDYGRVFAFGGDGTVRLVADGFMYCNGIAFDLVEVGEGQCCDWLLCDRNGKGGGRSHRPPVPSSVRCRFDR